MNDGVALRESIDLALDLATSAPLADHDLDGDIVMAAAAVSDYFQVVEPHPHHVPRSSSQTADHRGEQSQGGQEVAATSDLRIEGHTRRIDRDQGRGDLAAASYYDDIQLPLPRLKPVLSLARAGRVQMWRRRSRFQSLRRPPLPPASRYGRPTMPAR
jgi:hypothetical protein